jgi:hypothetical protein
MEMNWKDRIGVCGLGLGEVFSEKDQDTSCDEIMYVDIRLNLKSSNLLLRN